MPIDYTKYPPNWMSEIRPRILARANHCCEVCKVKDNSTVYSIKLHVKEVDRYKMKSIWFRSKYDAMREDMYSNAKKVKVVLTIAHLDHDEENHHVLDSRLMAMCQLCHLRYDAKEKYRRATNKFK